MSTPPDNAPRPPVVVACSPSFVLRQLEVDDAERFFATVERSRDYLMAWEQWPLCFDSVDSARTLLAATVEQWRLYQGLYCGIFDLHSGELAGGCTLSFIQHDCRCASLGYWVEQSAQGCNLATWAARELSAFAFDRLHLTRLEVVVREDNSASQRVAVKLGAQREGIARARTYHEGAPRDACVFSLLPHELRPAVAMSGGMEALA